MQLELCGVVGWEESPSALACSSVPDPWCGGGSESYNPACNRVEVRSKNITADNQWSAANRAMSLLL